jgi:stage III sporulation protein AB
MQGDIVMRWLGAVLLSAGSALLGLGAVMQLDGRVRDLRGIVSALEAMRRVLMSRLEPLDGMLDAAIQETSGRPKELFQFCRTGLEQLDGRPFQPLWTAAIDTVWLRLEEDDLAALCQLGGVLGRYDMERQADALEQTSKYLERQLLEAIDQRRRLGKVYGTMGVSAGLILALILM